jgi:uncharacterized cupredoxin-like copper-binding protein
VVRPRFISLSPPRRGYRRVAVLCGVIAAVAFAACGGSSDDNSSDETAASTPSTTAGGGGAGGGETVKISETEYKLTPSDVSVKPGEVTFDVTNDGSTLHNLEVEGPGEEAKTDDLDAGASGQVTVDLSKPGTYEMYCTIDGHRDLGMEGEITVQ